MCAQVAMKCILGVEALVTVATGKRSRVEVDCLDVFLLNLSQQTMIRHETFAQKNQKTKQIYIYYFIFKSL